MKTNKRNRQDQSFDSTEVNIAKLELLGSTLVTIGEGITTVAAGMAVQQLEQKEREDTLNQAELVKQMEHMQKQIDQLTYRLEKLDRKTK